MIHPVHMPALAGWSYVVAAPIEAGQTEELLLWCQDHSHRWWVVADGQTTRRLTDIEAARANLVRSASTPERRRSGSGRGAGCPQPLSARLLSSWGARRCHPHISGGHRHHPRRHSVSEHHHTPLASPVAPADLPSGSPAVGGLQLARNARWSGGGWSGDAVGHPIHPSRSHAGGDLAGGGGLSPEVVT